MIRRDFLAQLSTYAAGSLAYGNILTDRKRTLKDLVVGHGTHTYKVDLNWGRLDRSKYPVQDCHEMVIDARGRIILLTNHTQNNILIYSKDGKLEEAWGTTYPGGHGLTLMDEGGTDMLYITDTERHQVIKTTTSGKVLQTLQAPLDTPYYSDPSQYLPTESVVATNGDVYIADGYGLQHILHYAADGTLLNVFGGQGMADDTFTNAHGITIDYRQKEPTLLITDRMRNQLKRFSMSGQLLDTIHLPGAYICRPVIHGDYLYLATIWSGDGSAGTGFVTILDADDKVISAPCGSAPSYTDGSLDTMYQTLRVFSHPHDVCVDEDENLYIAQWNAGQSYPIKMIRV